MLLLLPLGLFAMAIADPGRLLPGAEPEPAGTLELRAGAVGVLTIEGRSGWAAGGPQLLLDWAPHDRVDLEVQAPLLLLSSFGEPGLAVATLPDVGARVLVLDRPNVRLAPTLFVGGVASTGALGGTGRGATGIASGLRGTTFGTVGLALEVTGPRLGFDANVSGFAWMYEIGGDFLPIPPWEYAFAYSQAGITWTSDGAHAFRGGITSLMPTVTWMYRPGPLLVDVTVASLGFVSLASGHVGWAF